MFQVKEGVTASNYKMIEPCLLDVSELSIHFGTEIILENISFMVQEREFVSIIGPSGCGKSTLMNAIAGFIQAETGQITVAGKKVTQPGTDRGVVFQDLALFPWLSVIDNVAFALRMKGLSKPVRNDKATEILKVVGLTGKERARIQDLSGGMKQRVALARTLVMEPAILLMDEPFSALDAQTRDVLQDELLRIHRQTNTTVIFITHNIDEAIYLSDKVLLMEARPGLITETLEIDLEKPRHPDMRTTARFNEYKRHLMEHLRTQNIL